MSRRAERIKEQGAGFRRKNAAPVLREEQCRLQNGAEMTVLRFPIFEQTPFMDHILTSRLGGVSSGKFRSVNFSIHLGDTPENVQENFRRAGEVLGTSPERMVSTDQTHTVNVRVVKEEDAGKGIVREAGYSDVDGLVTNAPGIVLTAYYADCVPLFIVDPVHRAIGLSHSGWRGTASRMGAVTIGVMEAEYGSDPADLLCAVGPSICRDCYEVGEDAASEFRETFPGRSDILFPGEKPGKYYLDLWKANAVIFQEAGVKEGNISVTDICTCCNPDLLHSHRASKGKRGNLGAFMMIRS